MRAAILSFLGERYRNAYKTKELAKALGYPKQGEQYHLLKETLRELQEENHIERIDSRKWGIKLDTDEVEGTLEISQQGHGFVETHERDVRTIFVHRKNLFEAHHGDVVKVSLLPERNGRNEEGEVIEILDRPKRQFTGKIKKIHDKVFFEADNDRFQHDIVIPKRDGEKVHNGDKVIVEVKESITRSERNLSPRIVEVLGKEGDPMADVKALIREMNLPERFPKEVMKGVQTVPEAVLESEIQTRVDLRNEEVFTIDPVDAKDFDDAVSIRVDEAGYYHLGVHIADVSHYVTKGSALDKEALTRGTSIYLVNQVIPMLPEELSNNICSLREGVDRLTYSVLMKLSPQGAVMDYSIQKTVINSKKRFTYQEVQAIIDSGDGKHAETVRHMNTLAKTLTRKRISDGSIDFDLQEVEFQYDETGRPVDVRPKQRLQSMRLVEEFMLLANQCVAKSVLEYGGELPFMYRVHDKPDAEKVKELKEFMKHIGVRASLNPQSSKSFQRMLEKVRGTPEEAVINNVTVRSMAKAVYSEKNIGHFGLGFTHYSHFTSPIRRYPDLIVHRILWEYQQGKTGKAVPYSADTLKDISAHSSAQERAAVEAERESVKIMQAAFMESKLGETFEAIINGVVSYGMYVETLPHLVDGLVHVRDMDDDYYEFDPKKRALIGKRKHRVYQLGDMVRVKVARVDVQEREVDFILYDE